MEPVCVGRLPGGEDLLSLEFLQVLPGTPVARQTQPINEVQRTCRPLAVLMVLVRPKYEVSDIVQMAKATARFRRAVKDAFAHIAGQAGQTNVENPSRSSIGRPRDPETHGSRRTAK